MLLKYCARHIIENCEVPFDQSFTCHLLERLCASVSFLKAYETRGRTTTLHNLLLPKSWILKLLRTLKFDQRYDLWLIGVIPGILGRLLHSLLFDTNESEYARSLFPQILVKHFYRCFRPRKDFSCEKYLRKSNVSTFASAYFTTF